MQQATLREASPGGTRLQADCRDCPADFVWDRTGVPWHETLWTVQLPEPLEGDDVRVVKLAVDGDYLVIVCKSKGEDWPYVGAGNEEDEAIHRVWCIEFP